MTCVLHTLNKFSERMSLLDFIYISTCAKTVLFGKKAT